MPSGTDYLIGQKTHKHAHPLSHLNRGHNFPRHGVKLLDSGTGPGSGPQLYSEKLRKIDFQERCSNGGRVQPCRKESSEFLSGGEALRDGAT